MMEYLIGDFRFELDNDSCTIHIFAHNYNTYERIDSFYGTFPMGESLFKAWCENWYANN